MNQELFLISAYEQDGYDKVHEVIKHLKILVRAKKIKFHSFFDTPCGADIQEYTRLNFEKSSIVLLLIDANYLADDYTFQYQQKAIKSGKPIIPIILKPCPWMYDENLNVINSRPKLKGITKPISEWTTKDSAYQDIIKAVVETIDLLDNKHDFNYQKKVSQITNENSNDAIIDEIRNIISEGDLKLAIDKLIKYCKEDENRFLSEAINYSYRINELKNKNRKGVIDDKQTDLTQNKIVVSILELIEKIKNE